MKVRISQILIVIFLLSASAFAKDTWINVRSKNFFLVGNANEKQMRQVATKLEQFRESFRLIFAKVNFNSSVQTNVIVFKDDKAYNPFKPKRANGKIDEEIAGYFQSGEDVNYITLSTEGEITDAYGVIFHEYTHFLLDTNFGRSQIPAWFNEGMAEYYQTFKIENDQKVLLGDIQQNHLWFLQQNQLIPFKTFFEIDHYSLQQNGNHSRSVYYAQAWALMHFLIQGNKGLNNDALSKFLNLLVNKVPAETAFKQAFQMDYATMENALKTYISQRRFTATSITFKEKLIFDTQMTTVPLSDSEANAYLGDLLYHIHEYDDAEIYLNKALAVDSNSGLANTALGLLRMRERKFDEAKKYLEKAVAADGKNHLAHYSYAYVLSRESMDEFGYVSKYPAEVVKKIRESLQKAVAIKPDFTESYRLLSFVLLVNGENLDESAAAVKKAMALQPGNQDYLLLLAQIYLRQEKYAEVKEIAENLVKTASEPEMRSTAQNLLKSVTDYEESKARYDKQQKDMEAKGIRPPKILKRNALSESEIAKIEEENKINGLNRVLPKLNTGENRVVGQIQKVACVSGGINYTVKTETEVLTFWSKNFVDLQLMSLVKEAEDLAFGCDAKVSDFLTVITFTPNTLAKAKAKGNVVSLVFVPNNFKLKTEEELAKAEQIIIADEMPSEENPVDSDQRRREGMLKSIANSLRKPQEGEARQLGIIEKIECSKGNVYFHVRTASKLLILKADSPENLIIKAFTPDVGQLQIGCKAKMPDIPAVVSYRPMEGLLTDNHNGEIISIEFVPKSFKLE